MKFRQYLLSEVHKLWDPFNAETRFQNNSSLIFVFYDKHFGIQYLSINFLESPRTWYSIWGFDYGDV